MGDASLLTSDANPGQEGLPSQNSPQLAPCYHAADIKLCLSNFSYFLFNFYEPFFLSNSHILKQISHHHFMEKLMGFYGYK